MPSSIKKVVAEGPNFDVAVNFMDNGGVRITLPDGPWAILGPSQRARARVKSASSRSKKQRLSTPAADRDLAGQAECQVSVLSESRQRRAP